MRTLCSLLLLLTGCTGLSAARRAELDADAQPAVTALQAAHFDDAKTLADQALTRSKDNARAAAVSALALYRKTAHDLVGDLLTIATSFAASALMHGDVVNQDFLDFALNRAETRLSEVDTLLATAERDEGVTLDLCPACWEVDWNRNGEVDDRDRRLFEVELGADGEPYPENDPRRRPTFHFDVADVSWLRALVGFQRALLSFAGAWDPNLTWRTRNQPTVTLKLRDAAKLGRAREQLLAGLTHAETCRTRVLAETDDEREWLPNPRQKDHALPMPVDDALFATWAGILRDVRALTLSEEGLDVAQLAQLGRNRWEDPPTGFLDLGALFTQPRDYALITETLDHVRANDRAGIERELARVLGPSYRAQMKPSPLVERLQRMKRETDRGEERLERKLRYLFWLN